MFTKAIIEKYFLSEKAQNLLVLCIGSASIITSLVFIFILRTNFYKGVALPIGTVGLMFLIGGYMAYSQSDERRKKLVYAFDMNPAELEKSELPRLKKMTKQLWISLYVFVFLFFIGAALYIYFIKNLKQDFWRGFGIALMSIVVIALIVTSLTKKRTVLYLNELSRFVNRH